jgi:hypothetical protein
MLTAIQAEASAATPKAAPITTQQVLDALIGHYRKPGTDRSGEILITEAQAPGSSRRADLVRIGMWMSRGTGIDVHEVKVSRPDWLRELDDPAKAEAWWPYCNRFWVAAPPGVVVREELPPGWGLMELPAAGRRFKVLVAAESRKGIQLTVPLMIELLRRADNERLAEIKALRGAHRADLRKQERELQSRQAASEIPRELRQRLNLLQQVEEALGLPLDKFGGWPAFPPSRITPEELAAYLTDAKDHVTVQRRAARVEREIGLLERTAEGVLKRLADTAAEGGEVADGHQRAS